MKNTGHKRCYYSIKKNRAGIKLTFLKKSTEIMTDDTISFLFNIRQSKTMILKSKNIVDSKDTDKSLGALFKVYKFNSVD